MPLARRSVCLLSERYFLLSVFLGSRSGGYRNQCVSLSVLCLAVIGVVTSLFNGRSSWFSVTRQIVIGCVAAGFTYGVGALLGVSMS